MRSPKRSVSPGSARTWPSASITNFAPAGPLDADQRLAAERLDVVDAALDRPDQAGLRVPEPRVLGPHAGDHLGRHVGVGREREPHVAEHAARATPLRRSAPTRARLIAGLPMKPATKVFAGRS